VKAERTKAKRVFEGKEVVYSRVLDVESLGLDFVGFTYEVLTHFRPYFGSMG
jgi:hypothetical protein